ncbi:hypothetical protein ABOM_005740, partial [Aspergillus bombycis]
IIEKQAALATVTPQLPRTRSLYNLSILTFHAVQSQGGSSIGWRADVSFKERVTNVYQMLTSLRLIQPEPDANLQSHIRAALTFEQKAFQDANMKVHFVLLLK